MTDRVDAGDAALVGLLFAVALAAHGEPTGRAIAVAAGLALAVWGASVLLR